jgi:hypothetical protein
VGLNNKLEASIKLKVTVLLFSINSLKSRASLSEASDKLKSPLSSSSCGKKNREEHNCVARKIQKLNHFCR